MNHKLLVIGLLAVAFQTSPALAKDKVREEFHKTYSLSNDGRVRLDNVNGKVKISAWDRSEVKVDAVKRGDRQEDLDRVKIEIESKPDQIRIRTKYSNSGSGWFKRGNSAVVDYDVKVPAHSRLQDVNNVNGDLEIVDVRGSVRASTVNGKLILKGLASDAELSSVNGAVQAAFDKLGGVQSVSLKTVNGGAEVTLPADADADVTAKTLNGGIEGVADLRVKKNWPVGKELNGTLGKGGTQVHAETVNGAIRFRQASAEK